MKEKLISKNRNSNDFRHLFRIMKLSFVLSFMMLNHVFAGTGQPKINLKAKMESMRSVFKDIKEQSGFYFVYNDEEVDSSVLISVELNDASLDRTMSEVLKSTGYKYVIIDDYVVVKRAEAEQEPAIQDQSRILKGVVKDASNGELLIGVNIYTQDKSAGTVTNVNGEFQIKANQNSTSLIFSYIGYEKAEVKISDKEFYVVELKASASDIEEVIVTGIFKRKAESFTGAAISVKAEELKSVGAGNLFQSLQNIDPSLNIMTSSVFGSDPNRLPEIQLRGNSSLPILGEDDDLKSQYLDDPNMPLFILDGFEASPTTIFDFDMERVESVTILKDAAAKAIYGSKAANGVIVIETKKPLSGDLRISYSGKLNVTAPDLSSYNLCNALEKLEVERIAGDYNASNNEELIKQERYYNARMKRALEGDDTYWLSKPLQTGVGQRHSLRLEMGEQKVKFIANLSYNNTLGVMKGSKRDNVAGSVSVRYRHKDLLFTNNISVTSNKSVNSPYGNFSAYAKMNPYQAAYNEDGTIANDEFPDDDNFGKYYNPLFDARLNTRNESSYFEFKNNFYAEWSIKEGIKLSSRIGLTKKTSESHNFLPAKHSSFDKYSDADYFRKGSYALGHGEENNIRGDINLNINKNYGKHFFMANFQFNVATSDRTNVTNYAEGFPSDNMVDFAFSTQYAENKKAVGFNNSNRELGVLAVLSYTYDNRYLMDATIRRNGSSKFGVNKRWGDFWSVGLGWNVHKEPLLKDFTLLKKFKIRGSIGTTGSQNFSTHQALSTYKLYLDRTYANQLGSYLRGLANPDLQWQSKRDLNIGFDLALGRFTARFDRYIANTTNMVSQLSLPPSVGFNSVRENVGEIQNKGYELRVSYQIIKSKNGFLNVNFSTVTNENSIVSISSAMRKYNEEQNLLAADRTKGVPVQKFTEGGSMGTIWAVKSFGIDPATGKEIFLTYDGKKSTIWSSQDQINAGNKTPKYRGNFGFNGEYKGFGMGVVARFQTGSQIYNQTLVNKVENTSTVHNVDKRVLEGRWKKPGDLSRYVRLAPVLIDGTWISNPRTRPTTRFVQDLSELDIASLNLYYKFDRAFTKKLGMSQLKVSMNMNDVYKFSTVKIERGTRYPFARTVSFSLNATF